jgi:hypothetical protein
MNAEYIDALVHLQAQLMEAGVRASTARTALVAYAAALVHQAESFWCTFYRSIYAALREVADGPLTLGDRALLPLLALIDDDLGSQLVDRAERARIRERFVEYTLCEASLPS